MTGHGRPMGLAAGEEKSRSITVAVNWAAGLKR